MDPEECQNGTDGLGVEYEVKSCCVWNPREDVTRRVGGCLVSKCRNVCCESTKRYGMGVRTRKRIF